MKKLTLFVTTHRLILLILVGTIFAASLFVVKGLNVEAFPDASAPSIEIVAIYEGKSPEEVERRITIPLEVGLAGMRGMERLNSISIYGLADVKCKFSFDVSYREARQEVINRLAGISLPDGVQANIIAGDMGEVMQYVVYGSNNLMELRTMQDWTIGRYIKTAQGVEDVASYGGFIKAYVVKVIPEDLIKYGITLAQVTDALSRSNVNVGGRTIEVGDQYYMVRGIGLIKSLEDIENNVVMYKNGKAVLIKNIAKVSVGNIPRTGMVIFNENDDVVMGNVILRRGEKSIPSIKGINAKIKELNEKILPKGITIVPYYERWNLISTVVKKVMESASLGIALVAITIFVFLGNLRAAIITALVIPISLALTLAVMSLMGDSANLLSIGAIDFGIIADIALVLTENYIRVARKARDSRDGAGMSSDMVIVKATKEVGASIILLVCIIVVAFIPIFTMKGAEKQIFSPMAKTYSYALFFTLLLTFTYLIASIHTVLEGHEGKGFRFVETLTEAYTKVVTFLLQKVRTVLITAASFVLLGFIVSFIMLGTEFLPKMDEGNVYIRITFPYSISLNKTHENAKKVRNILMGFSEAKSVAVRVGRPEDGTEATGPFNSEYYMNLHPYSQWKRSITKEQLEEEVRVKLIRLLPNASISLSQYMQDNLNEESSGVKGGENAIKIFGSDLLELDKTATQVKSAIEKIPGIKDIGIYKELGQPNLLIEANRENIAAVGLSVQEVLDMISAALGGKVVSQVIEGDKNFALHVSFPIEYRNDPGKISSIPILLPGGGVVPLSRVANIRYDTGASSIFREDHRRFIPIKFSVDSKDLGGTVKKAQQEVQKIKIPDGYFMQWSGMFNEMEEAFMRFYVSIPMAIFLILIILYMFYGNMRNVLLTAVAPICAVFGGLVSLMITGNSLSISAIVGFISIIGISTFKTSILIRHYSEVFRETQDLHTATLETVREKFRSILMVGLTASLGLLPAAVAQGVGSQIQRPLAIVVVGGMLIGTAIILLVMPLLFRYVRMKEE